MARRKTLVPPPGPLKGRRGKGKAPLVPPPPSPRARKPKLGAFAGRAGNPPPLPSPPPRPRASGGMGPPVQNPLMSTPGRVPVRAALEERSETAPGPAMARAVGTSPTRRAVARGIRGGAIRF